MNEGFITLNNKDSRYYLCVPLFFFTFRLFFLVVPLSAFLGSLIILTLFFVGLFFNIFDLLVEEEINHNIPFFGFSEFTSEDLDFSSKEPEDHGDGFSVSVVAWDSNVNELKRRVSIAKGDTGDVDIRSFNNGLLIRLGVNDNQELGFLELLGVLIGKGTRGPSGRRGGGGTSVFGVLDDGSLSVGSSANNNDIFWLVDGGNDSSSELNFLPGLFNVDDVDTFGIFMVNISVHFVVEVQSSEVGIGTE